jgi:hypothetical protein
MPISPPQFVRRLYTQLEKGKGMRFSAEEVDMLAEMGAIDAVSKFAADWVRQQSEGRLAAGRAEQLRLSAATRPALGTQNDDAPSVEESMRRARARSKPKQRGFNREP